ncbi:MAG: cation transporter [Oscillospiraceae bacterium]|nr:cation transporter [Oscillospiraceae bacterium]
MTKLLLKLFIRNYENTKDPKVRSAYGKLAGLVGILCNLILFAGKLAVGLLSGAVSVTADAMNNLTDASSSVVTLLGFKLAERPADEEHPYGHARIEYLSALAVAAMILIIGVELAKGAWEKILHPAAVTLSPVVVGVLIASVLVKLWMSLFCKTLGKKIDSKTLEATAADSRNDVISTLAVLCSLLLCYFLHWQIDGYMGMAVALFIFWSGCTLAKETISPLLGESASEELVASLKDLILSHEGVLGIHDLMVHDYGPGQCFASVHAEMDAQENPLLCHDILDEIERHAMEELRIHLVVHYDPVVTNDEELNRMKKLVEQEIAKIESTLTLHDFRMVRGVKHTNLIFDLVVPFSLKGREREFKQQIDRRVQFENKKYYTVITFESPFSSMPH